MEREREVMKVCFYMKEKRKWKVWYKKESGKYGGYVWVYA